MNNETQGEDHENATLTMAVTTSGVSFGVLPAALVNVEMCMFIQTRALGPFPF